MGLFGLHWGGGVGPPDAVETGALARVLEDAEDKAMVDWEAEQDLILYLVRELLV